MRGMCCRACYPAQDARRQRYSDIRRSCSAEAPRNWNSPKAFPGPQTPQPCPRSNKQPSCRRSCLRRQRRVAGADADAAAETARRAAAAATAAVAVPPVPRRNAQSRSHSLRGHPRSAPRLQTRSQRTAQPAWLLWRPRPRPMPRIHRRGRQSLLSPHAGLTRSQPRYCRRCRRSGATRWCLRSTWQA